MRLPLDAIKRICEERYNSREGAIEYVYGELPDNPEGYETVIEGDTVFFEVEECVNLSTDPLTIQCVVDRAFVLV